MINRFTNILIGLVILLLPVITLNLFTSSYSLPKIILLIITCLTLIVLQIIKVVGNKTLKSYSGKFDFAVVVIGLTYLVSTFVAKPNLYEAFFLPGITTVVLAGALLYYFITQLNKKNHRHLMVTLFFSGVILSIFSFLSITNTFAGLSQLPSFVKMANFTPIGNHINSLVYLLSLLPMGVLLVVKEKDSVKKILFAVAAGIMVLGLIVSITKLTPSGPETPTLLDFPSSWAITTDSIKNSPLTGVGPSNFITAFNKYKPLSFNVSESWNLKFPTARNYYLTVLTETGLLGIIALVILLITIYRAVNSSLHLGNKMLNFGTGYSLLTLLVLFAIFPPSPVTTILLFVLLALFGSQERKKSTIKVNNTSKTLIITPLFALFVFALINTVGFVKAELLFRQSINSAAANNGAEAYELIQETVNTNPYVDRFHSAYAQINLSLAQTIASKESLNDQDTESIAQLIQQAIREAKNTVSVNTQRSDNWALLGIVYNAVIPFAEGADEFAIQSYNQAIALEPTNPNLRISLGGIYYSLEDYSSAIDTFRLAVAAKPDLANSHFNLSSAYREKGEIEKAINEMTIVLSLVEKDSADFFLASAELETLEKRLSGGESVETPNLTPPQTQEDLPITPIELPAEAAPPEQEID